VNVKGQLKKVAIYQLYNQKVQEVSILSLGAKFCIICIYDIGSHIREANFIQL